MFELQINEKVYQFKFGMGFLREVNKQYQKEIEGIKDKKDEIGLQMMVMGLKSGATEFLVEVLYAANFGQNPRLTKKVLDYYIDDECEDIDALFESVIDFLKEANATKKIVNQVLENLAKAEAREKAEA